MKLKTTFNLFIISLTCIPIPSTYAKHLLGTNYAGMMGGVIYYSSGNKSYLDGGFMVQGLYNHNVESNLDALFSLEYASSDGKKHNIDVEKTMLMFGADIILSLNPGMKVNPFLNIGIRASNVDVSGPIPGKDDRNLGLGVGAGIEYELNQVILTRLLLQHDNVGEDEISTIEAFGGFWVADSLLFTLSLARDFESKGTSILGGLLFQH